MPRIPTFTTQARPTAEVGGVRSNVQVPIPTYVGKIQSALTDYYVKSEQASNITEAQKIKNSTIDKVSELTRISGNISNPRVASETFSKGYQEIINNTLSNVQNNNVKKLAQSSFLEDEYKFKYQVLNNSGKLLEQQTKSVLDETTTTEIPTALSTGNVDLIKKLSYNDDELKFLNQYSPDLKLLSVISSLSVTLHETIGHGSGNLDTYLDEDGNKQTLTRELIQSRLGTWSRGLEEMRAEILSLYTSVTFYDELVSIGAFNDWPDQIPKEKMIELIILNMVKGGPARWHSIVEGTSDVKGAHPMANTGITYYLLDNSNGISMEEIEIEDNGTKLYDLRFKITNLENVIKCIGELAHIVQRFTSTAPTKEVEEFMKIYAISTRDVTYAKKMKDKRDYVNNMVELNLQIFPEWRTTIVDGKITDVEAYTPDNTFDALMNLYDLAK